MGKQKFRNDPRHRQRAARAEPRIFNMDIRWAGPDGVEQPQVTFAMETVPDLHGRYRASLRSLQDAVTRLRQLGMTIDIMRLQDLVDQAIERNPDFHTPVATTTGHMTWENMPTFTNAPVQRVTNTGQRMVLPEIDEIRAGWDEFERAMAREDNMQRWTIPPDTGVDF